MAAGVAMPASVAMPGADALTEPHLACLAHPGRPSHRAPEPPTVMFSLPEPL
jgi:hypothetical protein